jgi:hypothetical protein
MQQPNQELLACDVCSFQTLSVLPNQWPFSIDKCSQEITNRFWQTLHSVSFA